MNWQSKTKLIVGGYGGGGGGGGGGHLSILADFGCNLVSRYGSHLMIVMIFVTQNNF